MAEFVATLGLGDDVWLIFEKGSVDDVQACAYESATAEMIAAAFNAATAVEALGYDGQEAIEKLPEMVRILKEVQEACLFADDDETIGVTSDPHISEYLFANLCLALPTRLKDSE